MIIMLRNKAAEFLFVTGYELLDVDMPMGYAFYRPLGDSTWTHEELTLAWRLAWHDGPPELLNPEDFSDCWVAYRDPDHKDETAQFYMRMHVTSLDTGADPNDEDARHSWFVYLYSTTDSWDADCTICETDSAELADKEFFRYHSWLVKGKGWKRVSKLGETVWDDEVVRDTHEQILYLHK